MLHTEVIFRAIMGIPAIRVSTFAARNIAHCLNNTVKLLVLNSRLFSSSVHLSCQLGHSSISNIRIGCSCRIGRSNTFLVGSTGSKLGEAYIKIGDNCVVNEFNSFRAGESFIDIGSNVVISQSVIFVATNYVFPFDDPSCLKIDPKRHGIRIDDNCFIGAASVILPGVRIRNGITIAANSTVTCDCYISGVYAGSPARLIRRY
jgi:acetyltransferase-like isoleucine patch superfamily enzyme